MPKNRDNNSVQQVDEVTDNSRHTTENERQTTSGATRTIGSMMGEIVWLMSQSQTHKFLSLADLEWLLMPPIILGQYKLFKDKNKKAP